MPEPLIGRSCVVAMRGGGQNTVMTWKAGTVERVNGEEGWIEVKLEDGTLLRKDPGDVRLKS